MKLTRALRSGVDAALKEFGFVRLANETPGAVLLMPHSKIDYQQYVGSGMQASVLMAPVQWIQTNFTDAELEVVRKRAGREDAIEGHPMVELINRPNPNYRGDALFNATLLSFIFDGNGYWLKKRRSIGDTPWYANIAGQLEELWYAPHWCMEPKWPAWDDSVFISHYEYRVSGRVYQVAPENVVHFRNGIDPRNTRKGISKIEPILSEIFADEEAGSWVASLLLNKGIPGVIISPESGAAEMEKDARLALEAKFREKFGGARRGEVMVSSGAVKVESFGFNPKDMDLGDIRNTPEERVCSMLGIPAAVVGFGTGVQQTKVGATMVELRKLAWDGGIIPLQKTMARDLQTSLLPEFGNTPRQTVRFNHDNVSALADDLDLKFKRIDQAVRGGWLRVDQAQRNAGLEVDPTQNLYLRPLNVIEIPAADAAGPKGESGGVKSELEQRIIARAPEGEATVDQRRLISRMLRSGRDLEKGIESRLLDFFDDMGRELEVVTLAILQPKAMLDEINAAVILDLMDMDRLKKTMTTLYEEHYMQVARSTYTLVGEVMGLGINLPDDRAAQITKMGGRRAGLVDLTEQTRKRLFRELEQARLAGEGPIPAARRIRSLVPAGPWSTPAVRAKTIARTETLHAQRLSTLDSFLDSHVVQQVLVFDNRTGFNDEDCAALDGRQVSLDEAYILMDEEHPNGTRAFAPVIG